MKVIVTTPNGLKYSVDAGELGIKKCVAGVSDIILFPCDAGIVFPKGSWMTDPETGRKYVLGTEMYPARTGELCFLSALLDKLTDTAFGVSKTVDADAGSFMKLICDAMGENGIRFGCQILPEKISERRNIAFDKEDSIFDAICKIESAYGTRFQVEYYQQEQAEREQIIGRIHFSRHSLNTQTENE